MKPVRCTCGRFARYDAYYAKWWCEQCQRTVKAVSPFETNFGSNPPTIRYEEKS